MPKKGRKKVSPKGDPFYLVPQTSKVYGPKKRSRSISYVPVTRTTETEYWHNDLFYPPLYHTPRAPVANGVQVDPPFLGTQITVSEGHPYQQLSASGPDLGGEFFTTKQYCKGLHGRTSSVFVERVFPGLAGNDVRRFYFNGPAYPVDLRGPGGHYNLFPQSIHSSDEVLDEKGATAVAQCKPTNSVANLATALGELMKDGLPHLPLLHSLKNADSLRNKAGGEFLNYEFAIKPTYKDLKDLFTAIRTASDTFKRFKRDAGRVVRSDFFFPKEVHATRYSAADFDPLLWYMYPKWATSPDTFESPGYVEPVPSLLVETSRFVWFKGAFTYHLPKGDDILSRFASLALQADQKFGVIPDLPTLWELTPWSWAIDWFSNMGDVIANINDHEVYGLVMRYGYVMEHTIVKHTYSCDPIALLDGKTVAIPPIQFVTETKVRRKANPFGFGITWEGLSPEQIAIAVALGISRGR